MDKINNYLYAVDVSTSAGHGGKRPGAGRDKVGNERINIRVPDEIKEWIESNKEGLNQSEYIRSIVEDVRLGKSDIFPIDLLKWLDRKRGKRSRNELIYAILSAARELDEEINGK